MKTIKRLCGALLVAFILVVCSLFIPLYPASADGGADATETTVDISAGATVAWGANAELKQLTISFDKAALPDFNYDAMDKDTYKYVQEYLCFNGKSVKEINEEIFAESATWTYTQFPGNSGNDIYKVPVLIYEREATRLRLFIHENYFAMLGENPTFEIKEGLSFVNNSITYVMEESRSFTFNGTSWEVAKEETDITESVSIEGWNVTGNAQELTYTMIQFPEGVLPEGLAFDIMDKAAWMYLQEYITLNGKTVKQINEETDTSEYAFSTFPSTADAKYKVPVIVHANGDKLEVKFHNSYLETLQGDLTIALKAGFYLVQGNTKYVTSEDVSLVIEGITEEDVTESVSIDGWNVTGNAQELTYTIIRFPEGVLPEGLAFDIMDKAAWMYLQEYITLNGKTVKQINEETDTSGYTFSTFPSTADAKYKVPVIVYANGDKLEVKFHNSYLQTLQGDLTIALKAGFTILQDSTKYITSEDVSFVIEAIVEEDITAEITIDGWNVTGNAQELTYTIIRFPEGVLPEGLSFDIMDKAAWMYLQEYITLNGKTVKEINEETDTSEYAFSTFPSTADTKYKVPVIVHANGDKLEVKFHNSYLETLQGDLTVALKAGFTILQGNTKYITSADVTLIIEAIVEEDITAEITIDGWNVTGNAQELTYTIIRFPEGVLPEGLSFDIMDKAAWKYLQNYITMNGVTVADINANVDTSDYVFSTFPSTADAKYKVPVIVYAKGNKLEVKFHNSYLQTLQGDLTIALKAGFTILQGNTKHITSADVSFVIEEIIEEDITSEVTIDGWWPTGDALELTYTCVQFPDGVLPETINYDIMDKVAWAYLQEYIIINGKSVKQINEETDTSGYTFSTFPSTENEKYKVPVILFENGNNLEIKIHNSYLKGVGDNVTVTVKAGLSILVGNLKYLVSEDVTCSVLQITETDITDSLSINGWSAAGDKEELTYTRIQFPEGVLPENVDYGILDKESWVYLLNYIYFNGKSIKQINEETDTSEYIFSTFPSTESDRYKIPVIIFENNGTLELKFHNSYLQTIEGDLEITIKEGLYVLVGATRYVVSKDLCYRLSGGIWADINAKYTVTYYLNGEVYGEVEEHVYKSAIVLRDNVATAPGYEFSGWEYTATDGIVQNMVIYGYVRPIAYTITYHLDGGVNASTNPIVYYITDGEIILKDATKEGATFKGWYTSQDYTQKVEKLSPEMLGNIELYALFEGSETESKGGCGSVVGIEAGLLALAGVAILFKKRKNNR